MTHTHTIFLGLKSYSKHRYESIALKFDVSNKILNNYL